MNLRPALALAGALAAALLAAPAAPAAAPTTCAGLVPVSLQLEIGYPIGTRAVRWNPTLHAVVVRDTDSGGHQIRPRIVRPSCQRWQAFWRTLDRAQVWRWHAEYMDRDVYDGWWWLVRIERGGARVDAHGANAEPGSYAAFQRAATALIAPLSFTTPPPPPR